MIKQKQDVNRTFLMDFNVGPFPNTTTHMHALIITIRAEEKWGGGVGGGTEICFFACC